MTDGPSAPLSLRLAEPEDLPLLLNLLGRMHLEIGIGTLDAEKSRAQVAYVIDKGVVLVVERDGEMIGTMGLEAAEWWYSRDKYLGDWWTYVAREHRASGAGKLLIDAAKGVAAKAGIPPLFSALGGEDLDRKRAFYRRAGLKEIGATFFLEA